MNVKSRKKRVGILKQLRRDINILEQYTPIIMELKYQMCKNK